MKFFCVRTVHLKRLLSVVAPVALLPLLFYNDSKETRCAYVILLMAIYWMFEVVHLSVTSLLPVFLFPLLGVITTSQASMPYMKDTIMLYLAGMVMAGAVERCNLHNRVALKILLVVGGRIHWLLLGFMVTSMFMSMWVSNMATTLMLLPIVDAVVEEVCRKIEESTDKNRRSYTSMTVTRNESSATFRIEKDDNSWEKSKKELQHGMLLGVAYAANVGGTGSLIGTAPNLVMYGIVEELYPTSQILSFATWLMYNVPPMIICVFIAWIYLYMVNIPKRFKSDTEAEESANIKQTIRRKYAELGPISFHECAVLGLFILLILLWFFRDPRVIPGWASLFPYGKMIKDATPAIGVVCLMFFIPADPFNDFNGPALVDWKYVQGYVPWGVLLLMGGSFSMAAAAQQSGLSEQVGKYLVLLEDLHPILLVLVLTTLTAFITEICSNTATASVLLPITSYLSQALRVHPIKLMMPVTIASSFAFMLPVATPPNAMVYEYSNMSISYMARIGIVMNFACIAVEVIAIHTLGNWIFDLSHFPEWAAAPHRT